MLFRKIRCDYTFTDFPYVTEQTNTASLFPRDAVFVCNTVGEVGRGIYLFPFFPRLS